MAWLGKTSDKRVASATFFTAQLDFEDAGELQIFVDEHILEVVGEDMEKGYMPADRMANAFNMLRANDLIWGYMVSNYMLGKDPFPFDLLYWNADSTAMPARAHRFYLEEFYIRNAFAKGELTVRGDADHARRHQGPVYHVATKEDHIAPAASVYRGAKEMTRADVRFVLSGSGHIAGVVNPPVLRQVPVLDQPRHVAADARGLAAGRRGDAGQLVARLGRLAARRARAGRCRRASPGARLGAIEPAPGSYVKVRFDAPASPSSRRQLTATPAGLRRRSAGIVRRSGSRRRRSARVALLLASDRSGPWPASPGLDQPTVQWTVGRASRPERQRGGRGGCRLDRRSPSRARAPPRWPRAGFVDGRSAAGGTVHRKTSGRALADPCAKGSGQKATSLRCACPVHERIPPCGCRRGVNPLRRPRPGSEAGIDREAVAERLDAGLDRRLDRGVAVGAVGGEAVDAPRRSSRRSRANSAAPKPRVVPAGVPRRTPEVTVGGCGSNGMPFLLQVMCARPSAASASLPVTPFGRRSTSIRWVSVPPVTMSSPPFISVSASTWAFFTTCAA